MVMLPVLIVGGYGGYVILIDGGRLEVILLF
jgi:hypothetical protein